MTGGKLGQILKGAYKEEVVLQGGGLCMAFKQVCVCVWRGWSLAINEEYWAIFRLEVQENLGFRILRCHDPLHQGFFPSDSAFDLGTANPAALHGC